MTELRALGVLLVVAGLTLQPAGPVRAGEGPEDEPPPVAGDEEATEGSEEAPAEADVGPPQAGARAEMAEEVPEDEAPDALRDPIYSKFVPHRRLLINRPRLTLETRGKIQVQYFNADSDDGENDDQFFLRRFRPFFFGHFLANWTYKLEIELSADIQEGDIDLNELDVRDAYVRFEGLPVASHRLTFGNQKSPFSRDFLTPSAHQLLIERTFVGDVSVGVPSRVLGTHFRGDSLEGKLAYWGAAGLVGHQPDARRLRFDSLVGGSGNLNEGLILSARLDLHPRGPMTFADGDHHSPEVRYTWSVAGYVWNNDGRTNRFSEGGESLDPERADLEDAVGVEVSGGLRGRGVTLDWQYNQIRARTVVGDFTGGVYVDGQSDIESAAIEGGYWLPRSALELGAAVSRADADGYEKPWDKYTLVSNFHGVNRFFGKIQLSHAWTRNRRGLAGEDYQESRVQIQYVW